MLNTVARQLLRGGSTQNEITLKARIDNLDDDLLVGETDNQAVLWRIVFVLGLGYEAFASIVYDRLCELDDKLTEECGTYSQSFPPGDGGT